MKQRPHFQTLTALKGLFILIIALHNTLSVTPLFSNIPGVSFLILFGGMLGNSMFFIISGFLLSFGYKDRVREHTLYFGSYLLRRLKKLYPMYLLSNLAALVIQILAYGISAFNIEKLFFTVLLQAGGISSYGPYNTPTWFLGSLMVCYILFFVICYYRKSNTHYLSFITAAVILGHTLISGNFTISFLSPENGVALMNFFLGCILAEIYPLISEKLHKWLQPLFLLLLPGMLLLMLSVGVQIIAGDPRISFAFVICPMILYLALVKGPCSRILQLKCFVSLGNISSSIFFWHLVIYLALYHACERSGNPIGEQQYILYFIGMLLFCWIISKLENRLRQAGKSRETSGAVQN